MRQYVVLGAGLDTFAYRNPHADRGLKVFEVDHPATQRWKRAPLQEVGIALPPSLTFAPVDFETQDLSQQLRAAGFDSGEPAFFSLLGVVIYLTEAAAMQSLGIVSRCAPGTEIVFEFSLPASRLSDTARASREQSMARVAAIGEPWITFSTRSRLPDSCGRWDLPAWICSRRRKRTGTYFSGRIDGAWSSAAEPLT